MLSVQNLCKRYGEIEALKSLSFQVDPGQATALLGPNGAGKSTAVKILVSLEKPDAGHYSWQSHDLLSHPRRIRELVSYVSQEIALDKMMTGVEFMRFSAGLLHLPWRETQRRAHDLLDQMGLAGAKDRRIEGYSGGMKRRLDLAAALLKKPKILILDEPTTGLDIEARERIWELTKEFMNGGGALILASHDFREVGELADDVLVLDRGAVVEHGPAEQLKTALGRFIVRVKTKEFMDSDDFNAVKARFESWGDEMAWRGGESFATMAYCGEDAMGRLQARVVTELETGGLTAHAVSVQSPDLEDVYRFALGGPK